MQVRILPESVCTSSSCPRGLMDKASVSEAEDCGFESRRGQNFTHFVFLFFFWTQTSSKAIVQPNSQTAAPKSTKKKVSDSGDRRAKEDGSRRELSVLRDLASEQESNLRLTRCGRASLQPYKVRRDSCRHLSLPRQSS